MKGYTGMRQPSGTSPAEAVRGTMLGGELNSVSWWDSRARTEASEGQVRDLFSGKAKSGDE